MPNRILPREGFRADFVGSILRNTVFDPVKTLLVILLFQHAPPSAAAYLPRQREAILKWLRVALALSLVRRMNSWLGRRAINRGTGDKYDWPREVIVVTGGSNGFGKQLVLMLAERARSRIAILDVITPDYTLPAGVKYFRCDITSTEAIAAAAVDIRAEFGEPTILINNAGIIYARPLLENTDREIQKMFEVNTLAQYKLLHQFLPDIVKRNHGMIVTIASQGGNCTTPGMTAYCASKAASINLHEGLTSELVTRYNAPRVRTVLVTPAFAKTFVTRDMIPEDSFLSPLLEPETVAEAVVDQVLKGQSGYVGVSASANWFTFNLRSMPLWYQTGLRDRLDRTVRVPEQKHAWVQRDE